MCLYQTIYECAHRRLHYVIRHLFFSSSFFLFILKSLFLCYCCRSLLSCSSSSKDVLPNCQSFGFECDSVLRAPNTERRNEANGNRRNDLYVFTLVGDSIVYDDVQMMSEHQTNLRRNNFFFLEFHPVPIHRLDTQFFFFFHFTTVSNAVRRKFDAVIVFTVNELFFSHIVRTAVPFCSLSFSFSFGRTPGIYIGNHCLAKKGPIV